MKGHPSIGKAAKAFVGCGLVMLGIIGCQKTPQAAISGSNSSTTLQQAMIEDLLQYHEAVAEGWAYRKIKEAEHGVDLVASRDRLMAQVTETTTNEQFADLIQQFAAALQDGHSQADTSHLARHHPHTWPIGFVVVEEGVIVGNLNWLASNPGIALGNRLIQVNGRSVEELVSEAMERTCASTSGARRLLAVDQLHWTEDASVRFSLERNDGTVLEVVLPCLTQRVDFRHRDREAFCSLSEPEGGVPLLRIPAFTWNEAAFVQAKTDAERDAALAAAKDQIDSVFASLTQAQGLILDLRGNAGGFELLSSYVAEHLVDGDFLYYTSRRQDTALIRSLEAYQGWDGGVFGTDLPQHPRRWTGFRHFSGRPYTGRLVVLINPRCFSTTDNLCAFLRDVRPETRFVGQPTGGGTGEPMTVTTLKNTEIPIRFCVAQIRSPHGRVIEGVGTAPNVLIEPTRDDVVQRHDSVLEAARRQFLNW